MSGLIHNPDVYNEIWTSTIWTLYIDLDRFKRGDILWIASDLTGKGAYIPAQDPYNLNAIDPALVARLRRLLEITNEENWTVYGIQAEGFAKAISQALTDLSKPFHAIFYTVY